MRMKDGSVIIGVQSLGDIEMPEDGKYPNEGDTVNKREFSIYGVQSLDDIDRLKSRARRPRFETEEMYNCLDIPLYDLPDADEEDLYGRNPVLMYDGIRLVGVEDVYNVLTVRANDYVYLCLYNYREDGTLEIHGDDLDVVYMDFEDTRSRYVDHYTPETSLADVVLEYFGGTNSVGAKRGDFVRVIADYLPMTNYTYGGVNYTINYATE